MSDISTTRFEASDAQLIAAVRSGDTDAYGELFDRHREAARRLSAHLVPGPDADDLVAESFTRVLTLLQAGKGPDEFFRAYLLTSIRRIHIDGTRRRKRVRPTADESELDRTVAFVDPAEMRFEQAAAAAAFGSLPQRWQLVLWHLDVEGQKPAEIAPLLGMSANSVSALAYRAREGLRQAYLQNHLAPTLHASCRTTTSLLGSYVRKGLSARDSARVESHLDECSRCTGLYLELAEINSNLSGILGPALLGSAAAGYVSAGAAATGISAVVEAAMAPAKAAGSAVTGAGTQGVVAAAVVAVATVGAVVVANELGTTADDRAPAAAPRTSTPKPSETTAPRKSSPEPEPVVTTPAPAPTPRPTSAAPAAVRTDKPADPKPSNEPPPKPTAPAVEPIAPTDYGIASVRVTSQLLPLLERHISVDIGATNTGRPGPETVTVTLEFQHAVHVGGVISPGWSCGNAAPNQSLRTLTCSTRLAAGRGTTFVASSRDLIQSGGTISVSAPGDPAPGNDSASFAAGLWPLG
ncbi:sigma-70 family RNA polymerase sigma factor [Aeromicrobium sp. 9AM]|uniref:sigma-70 family RNA polymerase sigma factor n=1 Tax=Aeromicrobium sp. 9AM TaxID=2653126 RepID=UPI00135CE101|nr:sigma-70 family RNA polymerase sigma factor [Aeromicrobium sp. 9AM]